MQKSKPEAVAQLHNILNPGDTVYTILRHRSASGLTRWISAIVLDEDRGYGPFREISMWVGWAIGRSVNNKNHEGVECGGAGMDMGFDLVYSLGRTLWPDGFPCIGEKCLANDHVNGDRDYTVGHCVHTDGGYALRQRWL